jgi:hypothetical protein
VAGLRLIDDYLAALAAELRGHPTADDAIDEAADHLHSAVERHLDRGASFQDAQRRAIASFGGPAVIGHEVLSAQHEGARVPTRLSITCGRIGLVAVLAAAGAVTSFEVSRRYYEVLFRPEEARPWETIGYVLLAVSLIAVAAFGLGLAERLGQRGTGRGQAAFTLVAVGAGIGIVVPWAVPAWATLVVAGFAVLLSDARHRAEVGWHAWLGLIGGVGLLTGTAWTFIHEALRPTYPGTAVGERLLLGGFLLIALATSLGAARLAGERAALPEAAVLD